jgi:hypothetical protein
MPESHRNKVPLLVVVNGTPTPVEANLNAPLRTVAQQALNESGNNGRPLQDWEFKDPAGSPLDLDRKVGEYRFSAGAELFLTLGVGVNGVGVCVHQ